jgi:hypothetical protein
MLLKVDGGGMPMGQARACLELLAGEVAPQVRTRALAAA